MTCADCSGDTAPRKIITGKIFNIQHFCVDDGPGIRTTVFLKGCPLRCAWCHNPEGLSRETQLLFHAEKCTACGRCAAVCENDAHVFVKGTHTIERSVCMACGKCAEACLNGALEIAGRTLTAEETVREVLKDEAFYIDGGGITVSGGEPLMQADFTAEILRLSKKAGIGTCVETSGFAPRDKFAKVIEYTDILLFDIKETDRAKHIDFTGAGNDMILDNLKYADSLDRVKIILRLPTVPGYNLRDDHFEAAARLANGLNNVSEIHIEPYHPLGVGKYADLGLVPRFADKNFADKEEMKKAREYLAARTDVIVKVN